MNRLLEDDQYSYSYDANGNMLTKTNKTTTAVTTYQYDAENRLINLLSNTANITYQYDAMGRRIAKTVNDTTTKYVYDNKDVLLDLDENDKIKARYTRTLDIDELISVDRDTTNDGTLDTSYYYHKDGLGSVTTMTNDSAAVVQAYSYDSFGNVKYELGTVENRYTYTSREKEEEVGLYYYRARFYDANAGRFMQEDPKGFDAGINFYAYVQNNPVIFVDPLGLSISFWCKLKCSTIKFFHYLACNGRFVNENAGCADGIVVTRQCYKNALENRNKCTKKANKNFEICIKECGC